MKKLKYLFIRFTNLYRKLITKAKVDNGALSKYKERIDYLEYEVSRLSSLVRFLSAPVINDLPYANQTRSSFDFQWDKIPLGRFNIKNEKFRQEAAGHVCEFTGLDAIWFKGKNIADVGCGNGRYSWALSKMGANVLSMDQSKHGLAGVSELCKDFSHHRTKEINLLEPLVLDETFDLVWCFGVLHHTGDTYGGYRKIVPLVKPGGYLFMMIYGEPRMGITGDYMAVNEYELWRHKLRNLSFDTRLDEIKKGMDSGKFAVCGDEYIEGYFDAISPIINDLYSWVELESWLVQDGFVDIKRTVDTRNHFIIARKPA